MFTVSSLGKLLATACSLSLFQACVISESDGPGAAGEIGLGTVNQAEFAGLHIVAFPVKTDSFDPHAVPSDIKSGWAEHRALRDMKFPHRYQIGKDIGSTPDRRHRLVAWVSKTDAKSAKI